MTVREANREKWSELQSESFTRVLYGKRYRVRTPEGGQKFLATEAELEQYLTVYYSQ